MTGYAVLGAASAESRGRRVLPDKDLWPMVSGLTDRNRVFSLTVGSGSAMIGTCRMLVFPNQTTDKPRTAGSSTLYGCSAQPGGAGLCAKRGGAAIRSTIGKRGSIQFARPELAELFHVEGDLIDGAAVTVAMKDKETFTRREMRRIRRQVARMLWADDPDGIRNNLSEDEALGVDRPDLAPDTRADLILLAQFHKSRGGRDRVEPTPKVKQRKEVVPADVIRALEVNAALWGLVRLCTRLEAADLESVADYLRELTNVGSTYLPDFLGESEEHPFVASGSLREVG